MRSGREQIDHVVRCDSVVLARVCVPRHDVMKRAGVQQPNEGSLTVAWFVSSTADRDHRSLGLRDQAEVLRDTHRRATKKKVKQLKIEKHA